MMIEGGLIVSISSIASVFGLYFNHQIQNTRTQITIARLEERIEVLIDKMERMEAKIERLNGVKTNNN